MSAVATAAAEMSAVTVRIGDAVILDQLDLAARDGELLAIVGPNGAGKSTALHAMAGDVVPTAGTVTVAGRPAQQWSRAQLARHRAVLPQDTQIAFPFRVREVVEMGRAPWSRVATADQDDAAVAAALEQTDTAHLADRRYPTLSGGERARVALARVLAQQTPLLLLDEPTAALDVRHQELVMAVARRRAEAGDAVVAVLHDLSVAAAYANRIALLSAGRLVAQGLPSAVLDPVVLSEVYEHRIEVLRVPGLTAPVIQPTRRR